MRVNVNEVCGRRFGQTTVCEMNVFSEVMSAFTNTD